MNRWKNTLIFRVVSSWIIASFFTSAVMPSNVYAQGVFNLPQPGQMVELSSNFAPVILKGVSIHPEDPLLFDFIVDNGQTELKGRALTSETTKLVKYFLAGLAVPEKELWVNLSPKEKDRIMAEDLSHTDVGRDLLAQDYILKQITSTLMYPEKDLGRKFWDEVYSRTYEKFGNTNVPVDSFNKVWIMPDEATVYQNGNNAFVMSEHFKVMLESDYEAASGAAVVHDKNATMETVKDVVRSVILPVLEKEVNNGRNFAELRQVFHSLILAGWYKNALKESLLNQVYSNTNKVESISIPEKDARERIYAQYLESYQKGVYNYITEEFDRKTQETSSRKYFSGGIIPDKAMNPTVVTGKDAAMRVVANNDKNAKNAKKVQYRMVVEVSDAAQTDSDMQVFANKLAEKRHGYPLALQPYGKQLAPIINMTDEEDKKLLNNMAHVVEKFEPYGSKLMESLLKEYILEQTYTKDQLIQYIHQLMSLVNSSAFVARTDRSTLFAKKVSELEEQDFHFKENVFFRIDRIVKAIADGFSQGQYILELLDEAWHIKGVRFKNADEYFFDLLDGLPILLSNESNALMWTYGKDFYEKVIEIITKQVTGFDSDQAQVAFEEMINAWKMVDMAQSARVLSAINPTRISAWSEMRRLASKGYNLRELELNDPERAEKYRFQLTDDIMVDFSKNYLDDETMKAFLLFADEVKLRESINLMFAGEKINETEGRSVLHMALRNVKRDENTHKLVAASGPVMVDGKDVMPEVIRVLEKMEAFISTIHSGEWKGFSGKIIKNMVNVGIGGSDLGPKAVAEALKPYRIGNVNVYFVSNIDGTAAAEVMRNLDPEETLVNIVSKTFTTQETIQNATTLKNWVLAHYNGDMESIKKHFIASSTAKDLVAKFGIDTQNMFEFWDWVGGRFSVWSAVGLTLATYIGFDNFLAFLQGAHEVDVQFYSQPFNRNIPVIKAFLDIFYANLFGVRSFAILPYDQYLNLLPAFQQQSFMESLGKSVDRNGHFVDYQTGLSVFGAAGTDGQHSFYQKVHQGTDIIPADFIGVLQSQNPLPGHHLGFFSNFVAQPEALAYGVTLEEAKEGLATKYSGDELDWQAAQRTFAGNKPTTSILIRKLTPRAMGALVAMYEHQVAAESFLNNTFAFDQWGVQLGKLVATNQVVPALEDLDKLSIVGLSTASAWAVRAFVEANRGSDVKDAEQKFTLEPYTFAEILKLLERDIDEARVVFTEKSVQIPLVGGQHTVIASFSDQKSTLQLVSSGKQENILYSMTIHEYVLNYLPLKIKTTLENQIKSEIDPAMDQEEGDRKYSRAQLLRIVRRDIIQDKIVKSGDIWMIPLAGGNYTVKAVYNDYESTLSIIPARGSNRPAIYTTTMRPMFFNYPPEKIKRFLENAIKSDEIFDAAQDAVGANEVINVDNAAISKVEKDRIVLAHLYVPNTGWQPIEDMLIEGKLFMQKMHRNNFTSGKSKAESAYSFGVQGQEPLAYVLIVDPEQTRIILSSLDNSDFIRDLVITNNLGGRERQVEYLNSRLSEIVLNRDDNVDNAQQYGGIDIGHGNYLKVIATDAAGVPSFDPVQIQQLQKDLRGLIPVPVGGAQPVNWRSLLGFSTEEGRQDLRLGRNETLPVLFLARRWDVRELESVG